MDKHMLLFHQRSALTVEEKAAFLDSLTEALVTETAGLNPLADHLMGERDAFRARAVETGKIGAQIRESLRVAKGSIGCLQKNKGALALRTDGRTDERTLLPKTIGRTEEGGSSGDKYSEIFSIPERKLADWASTFCGDKNRKRGAAGFQNRLKEIGPDAFRSILAAFVGEVEAGEEPDNRGSALQARMKKAVAS